jgi:hypothetical protein
MCLKFHCCGLDLEYPSKAHELKALVPTMVLLGGWSLKEVEPNKRSLSHWGVSLEGISLLPRHEVSGFAIPHASIMANPSETETFKS